MSNPASVKWEAIDSTSGFCACKTGNEKLSLNDTVTVTFEGYINRENKWIPVPDSSVFGALSNLPLGKQTYSEARTNLQLDRLLSFIGRDAEYYLRIKIQPPPKPAPAINIYLNNGADSAKALAWALQLRFARSVKYTSKEAAKREMLGEDAGLGTIPGMNNPLPNTITITIDPALMNKRQLDSIKLLLLSNKMVNTVNYPNPDVEQPVSELSGLFHFSFVFKVNT